jgi:hypothetical protein
VRNTEKAKSNAEKHKDLIVRGSRVSAILEVEPAPMLRIDNLPDGAAKDVISNCVMV